MAVKWCGKFKRRGKDSTDYDLVVGGVANDKVFNTVELFFDGLIDKAEAINRLRYEKPNLQICFRTEKALHERCVSGRGIKTGIYREGSWKLLITEI